MTESKAGTRSKTKEEFRIKVLETARRLFLQKGVDRTSMADLGRVLGVSKPTVYEAFRSKQLLMDAVFEAVAHDVEMDWLMKAAAAPPRFETFLDQTSDGYKRILESPRSVEAFSLLIREGGQQASLTDTFMKKLTIPATQAGRTVIKAAIQSGECAPLDVGLVQKMVDAPLMHVLVDRTLFGKNGMTDGLAHSYIDHSFGALKTLLCGMRVN